VLSLLIVYYGQIFQIKSNVFKGSTKLRSLPLRYLVTLGNTLTVVAYVSREWYYGWSIKSKTTKTIRGTTK
jgi:hypothetical protein